MKAVYIQEQGDAEVLTYGERPEPVVGPGEVKIRVRACSLNRLDLYMRAGARGMKRELSQPLILGGDVSGDVAEVGDGVATVKPGDRVVTNPRLTCGHCAHCLAGQDGLCRSAGMLGTASDGGYAEYVKVPATNVLPIADSLSYENAAALPTVFMPCWSILIRRARVQPWETVLVLSASSGVGTAAIQVASKVIGARVIATTSTDDKARDARALGADEVIVYTQEDIEERVKELTDGQGVDAVVDHVGSDFWEKAFASLRIGGRYGICGVTTGYRAQIHLGAMFTKQVTVFGVFMGNKEDLREIVEMAGRGVISGTVHRTFPLAEAAQAHQEMEEHNFSGKLVLVV